MALNVATYEQILTILSQLATNYTNIFDVYYKMFYSDIPEDLVIQLYDESGNLNSVSIPNRAKDRAYILNGDGDPSGNVSASKGSIYQDITNGTLYLNIDGTYQGWSKIVAKSDLNEIIMQGATHPEGNITASRGTLFSDTQNGVLYIKTTSTGSTGWIDVSADLENIVNADLSNLSDIGERHFANPSLNNLNSEGNALINAKEDTSNKVTTIDSSNTNSQYPSAKAVYDFGSEKESLSNKVNTISSSSDTDQYPSARAVYNYVNAAGVDSANKSLSNLNSEGQGVLDAKESTANKVTSINSGSTNSQYPSARAVYNSVSSKASTDLSNASSSAFGNLASKAQAIDKVTLASWGMPDFSAGISFSSGYSAPSAGWIILMNGTAGGGQPTIDINGNRVQTGVRASVSVLTTISTCVPVKAGDVITYNLSQTGTFFPMRGR